MIPEVTFPNSGLTASQMREVDRVALEEFGIDVLQLMEMAGFQMARLVQAIEGAVEGKRVAVAVGKGNNGADGLVAARYLSNWGAEVTLTLPETLNEQGKHQFLSLKKMDVSVSPSSEVFCQSEIVIDCIIGYSLSGEVRSPYVEWIQTIDNCNNAVYSLDIPSGLDPNDGSVHGVAVEADYTLTLGYPKKGLLTESASRYVGELYLADIGIPKMIYDVLGIRFVPHTSLVKIQ